jgi:hypothetical protein
VIGNVSEGIIAANKIELVFILLIAFQLKHFIADFPLQFPFMLRKHAAGWDFIWPLSLHCAVHAVMTLVIVLAVKPSLWYLAVLDFLVHFAMDRIKAGPRFLGRFNDSRRTSYWAAFGFDQMVHHLTHFYIIWVIIHAA